MITVALHGAEFFARHGFYPEEQLLGCKFLVDISVGFMPVGELHEDNLANTVNYEQLYRIACLQMQQPRKLIETLAQAILDDIKKEHSFVETIVVTIKKLNPPMRGRIDHSGVTISYTRSENGIQ
ncbi:MAG: folB [Mucilaginibacter sp.]|nr:folB [Mucilaginibacter sp.]